MNVSEERMRAMVAEEAADWFVANREGLDAVQRDTFTSWLKTSPMHVEEYLGVAQLACDLRAAGVDPEVSLDALLERARAADETDVRPIRPQARYLPASIPRRGWLYAAAAAALAIVGLSFLWSSVTRVTPPSPRANVERFSTQHGQQLTQRLADASVLYLNTETSVTVRYERTGRRVNIERGQVIFEVARDAARPFRVTAGTAEVVAVGTKFDVYLQPGSTLVTVVEGRVTVAPVSAAPVGAKTGATTASQSMRVDAGQQVRVIQGELPAAPSQVDVQRATAWLHRQISFEREPLVAVAAEFNRYTKTPIEIETAELRGLAISGVFAVDDTESFVAFLRSLNGVGVEVTATRIRVFKK